MLVSGVYDESGKVQAVGSTCTTGNPGEGETPWDDFEYQFTFLH